MNAMTSGRIRVLALASSGGHWVQLLRLRPAFDECEMVYASTRAGDRHEVGDARFHAIPDANRWQKLRALWCGVRVLGLVLAVRPRVIVTTGALPGYFAVLAGRLVGAHAIWVDSIANADELSMSGQWAGKHVDLWITQWEHLAAPDGPFYYGNVLG